MKKLSRTEKLSETEKLSDIEKVLESYAALSMRFTELYNDFEDYKKNTDSEIESMKKYCMNAKSASVEAKNKSDKLKKEVDKYRSQLERMLELGQDVKDLSDEQYILEEQVEEMNDLLEGIKADIDVIKDNSKKAERSASTLVGNLGFGGEVPVAVNSTYDT